jgi:hypothetical protein
MADAAVCLDPLAVRRYFVVLKTVRYLEREPLGIGANSIKTAARRPASSRDRSVTSASRRGRRRLNNNMSFAELSQF